MPETAAQMSSPSPQEHIQGIVNNYWQACAVGVATQLELADLLDNGPLHLDVLAQRTKTHAPSLFRMLRALESTGIFTQVSPQVFANTPASACLRRSAPGSQWAWVRICLCADSFVYEGWSGLMLAVQNGQPGFDQVRGMNGWKYLQANPEWGTHFNVAMRDVSALVTPAITASYNWSQFPVIADIAGGIGTQLADILDAHPSCRGILFDQPQVIAQALPQSRMEKVHGDFFTEIPVEADAYILRWIIHDWAEPQALAILANIKKAAKPDSELILLESVIPETPDFHPGKWMDVNMLVMVGGRERTASEFRALYHEAGFELDEIVPTPSPLSIITGKLRV